MDPHTNYEPTSTAALREAALRGSSEQGPTYTARLTRASIERQNDYAQAADRYHTMMDWESEDLILNVVSLVGQAAREVQERMVWHFYLIDDDLGNRVGEGLGIKAADVAHLEPLPRQILTGEDQQRLANLGNNSPRTVSSSKITGSVEVKRLADVR